MQTEIEVKFPQIDIEDMREQLQKAGAVCEQPMRLMRRRTFDNTYMKEHKGYGRVRDEGDKITVTYKQFDDFSVHGAKEVEIVVSDFDKAVELLRCLGAGTYAMSYQESRRETWQLGDVEVVIDEWPWLDPFIEIEGSSEEAVKNAANRLGFDWRKALTGSIMAMYWYTYPEGDQSKNVGYLDRVALGEPLPDMFKG